VCLGFSAIFIRWAKVPGPVTSFYRLFFAALILTPFALFRMLRQRVHLSWSSLVFPLIAGLFSAVDFATYSVAVNLTTAGTATLLGNAAPLWVAFFALLVFREKLHGRFWIGLAITLAGAVLVVGTDFLLHPVFGRGDTLALMSSLFYAGYYISTQRGRQHLDPLTYVWLATSVTAAGLFVINLAFGNTMNGFPAQTWLIFLTAAIFSQILGYLALTYVLGHLPASVVSPTLLGQPVMTTLLAIPFLHEIPEMWQIVGGLLVLVGVFLVHQAYNRASSAHAI
jgi:drug/metabolite transporter (DMT)-like permease